jgi:nucleoside-diphosphate-sugar epimerase
MRVLVAGATSVPGLPLLREINARGHEVVGVTRSSSTTSQITAAGAKPIVAKGLRARKKAVEHRRLEPGRGRATGRCASRPCPAVMDESDPYPGPPPGGDQMLAALRGMETNVLSPGEHSDTEGIVLRYGCFYGPGVPHDELFVRLAKWRMLPAMAGDYARELAAKLLWPQPIPLSHRTPIRR